MLPPPQTIATLPPANRLGAAAPADDQQVLVNPADLGARQAGLEGRHGRVQRVRRVEGDVE
jgi:hypothetical protein